MAALAEKTPARRTGAKQKTNFSKNGLNDGLNAESSQKLLFYLLEKMDNRFLWMIGIMFTGFIGVITIILSKF